MPNITVSVMRQSDVDKKRRLVAKLTEVIVESYGVPKEAVTVEIRENEPENVGVGGVLLADRFRQAGH